MLLEGIRVGVVGACLRGWAPTNTEATARGPIRIALRATTGKKDDLGGGMGVVTGMVVMGRGIIEDLRSQRLHRLRTPATTTHHRTKIRRRHLYLYLISGGTDEKVYTFRSQSLNERRRLMTRRTMMFPWLNGIQMHWRLRSPFDDNGGTSASESAQNVRLQPPLRQAMWRSKVVSEVVH
jgi:hypothetical protein